MVKRVLPLLTFFLIAFALFSYDVQAAADIEPPPVILEIPKVDGSVTIDGDIGDAVWSQARRLVIPRALLEPALPNADDVSGEARIFWNNDGLYVAFKVDDRKLMLADEEDSLREFDAVQFWFDKLWIQVGLTQDGSSRCTVTNLGNYVPLIETYIDGQARKSSSGYTAEIFIPNSVANLYLKTDLQTNAQIRVAFAINNRYHKDRPGYPRNTFPNRYGFNTRKSFALGTLQ